MNWRRFDISHATAQKVIVIGVILNILIWGAIPLVAMWKGQT